MVAKLPPFYYIKNILFQKKYNWDVSYKWNSVIEQCWKLYRLVDFDEVFFNRLDYYIKKFTGKRKKIYGIENSNY